jgi:SAM-dependent methyltransferase
VKDNASEASKEEGLSCALPSDRSYDPQFFAKIVAVEDRHFWFRARNDVIANAVISLVNGLPSDYRLLEVGCGTGVVLRHLAGVCQQGSVLGLDLYPEAVSYARERTGCEVVLGDVLSPPESLGQFDIVCMFDVLEHLPDERQTLMAIDRVLKPGGSLVLTVPAHPSLWSYFDVAACHCRRYDRRQVEKLLQENQFRITYLTEFMMLLYPLIWLFRRAGKGKELPSQGQAAQQAASEFRILPGINGLLGILLSWERSFVKRGWSIPIGTSLLAIAQKSGN